MKKLTLVSLMCNGVIVQAFCLLTYINGKAILPNYAIDELFHSVGVYPERGDTISIGI